MPGKTPITVVILTLNEEPNIGIALNNVMKWAEDVMVLDSGSIDDTCKIAKEHGAKIYHRDFDNYASQRNYAIQKLPISTEWMFFLDADEYMTEELKGEIRNLLEQDSTVDGYWVKRRFYFMGKWIKHGGYYPTWLVRMFKVSKGICEREINEHIKVNGQVSRLKHDIIDDNHKSFMDWIEKHNRYSTFEAHELLKNAHLEKGKRGPKVKLYGDQLERKQWLRHYIWGGLLPPLLRPFVYFFYRYFFRLGFLDGRRGFIYHFMQGLVLHFIIDIKYLELKMKRKK